MNNKYDSLLKFHPEYKLEILTQDTEESQNIIYEFLNSNMVLDKDYLHLIESYKDNAKIQRRLLAYGSIPEIRNNEIFLSSMLNITNEIIEKKLRCLFINGKIKTIDDFEKYIKIIYKALFFQEKVKKLKIVKKF